MNKCLKKNSEILSLLRFPLIVGVVFIHSLSLPHGVYKVYDFFYYSLTEMLCGTCVPLFFFFSGYLFFQNIDSFNLTVYTKKIRRRIKSLLIPYIFWNLFVVAVIGIGQHLAPSLFTGAFKNVLDFNAKDWISLFWCAFDSSQPIAFQLWFLRDLMVATMLSPIIYFFCRFLNYWFLFVLFLLPLIGINRVFPGLMLFSLSFFATGCWFGIKKTSFSMKSNNAKYVTIIVFLLLYCLDVYFHESNVLHSVFHSVNIVLGCIAIIQFASLVIEKRNFTRFSNRTPKINNSTFFIYCYHGIFSAFISNVVIRYTNSDFKAVFSYFAIVVVLVVLGVVAYNALLKLFPRFTMVITGGRS